MPPDPLPAWLSGRYTRYKADTFALTNWVTATAISVGFDAIKDNGLTGVGSFSSSRREQASEAPVKISVRGLVEAARHIVQQHPAIQVPGSIISAGRRAIDSRAMCSRWYQSQSTGSGQVQNKSHVHFLESLQLVVETLKGNNSISPDKSPVVESTKDRSGHNRYQLLEVEEEEDLEPQTLTTGVYSCTANTANHLDHLSPTNKKINCDWIFKAACTFEDFDNIREHILDVWKDYGEGKIDLIVASVITELCFQIMDKLEKGTLHPTVVGVKLTPLEVTQLFSEQSAVIVDPDRNKSCDADPSKLGSGRGLDIIARLKYLTGYSPLSKTEIQAKYGAFDLCADWSKMPGEQQDCHDKTILTRLLSSTTAMHSTPGYDVLLDDYLTRKLEGMIPEEPRRPAALEQNKATSVALLFVIQILIDIHHILRGRIAVPSKQLRIVAGILKANLREHGRFLSTRGISKLRVEPWNAQDERELRGISSVVKNVEDDELAARLRAVWPSEFDELDFAPNAPFSLNPVLSGLYLLGSYLYNRSWCFRSADAWFGIIPVAHLYVSLLDHGVLQAEWPWMEKFLKAFTPEYVFHGGRPKDLVDCLKKFHLASGGNAEMSLTCHGDRDNALPRTRPRRMLSHKPSPAVKVLHDWMFPQADTGRECQQDDLLPDLLSKAAEARARSQGKIKAYRESSEAATMPLEATLDYVRSELTKELPALKIDMYGLNDACTRILLRLHEHFTEDATDVGAREGDPNGKLFWHNAVIEILFLAISSDERHILRRVGDVFRDELKLKG